MRFRIRPGGPRSSYLKRTGVILGGIFVLLGIAALIGDADQAQAHRRTAFYVRSLNGLRDVLGDPGAGIALILVGLALAGLFWWLADCN